jgi:GntR family transcriptional regulator
VTLAEGDASGTARDAATLRRESHVSLYAQIADLLRRDITSGVYPPLSKLPSEPMLVRRLGVSRVTVRLAIDLLIKQGLVIRKQGKGTFVAGSTVRHELQELRGFYDVMVAQGLRPQTRLLKFELKAPPPEVVAQLGTAEPALMFLQRSYSLEGAPIGLASTWLPADARQISWQQAEIHPSYAILQDLLGMPIARADVAIRGRLAGRPLGRMLNLPSKSAVLVLERISYGAGGAPLESTSFVVNSESYEFTLSVQGPLPINARLRAAKIAS